jgi:hypothetical protein
VFETRATSKWVRELVGTARIADLKTAGRLRDELSGLLLQAVIGVSRLPLTSLESPLPAFTLGHLAYCFDEQSTRQGPETDSIGWCSRLADCSLSPLERAKLLESALRSVTISEVPALGARFLEIEPNVAIWIALLFEAFNGISLSPYTCFVQNALTLLRQLTEHDFGGRARFLSRLILHIDRHLVAYDLIKFHQRGANYPDALLLDELWADLLPLVRAQPELLTQSTCRRAIRHALFLRIEYAGHPVPDYPTSVGENARVMPEPFAAVADEQIHAVQRRKRRLFTDPLPDDELLWKTFNDLDGSSELVELGTALFLDRPFGGGKQPGEPDRTPLISHRLFSPSVAERRLNALRRQAHAVGGNERIERWINELRLLRVDGVALSHGGSPPRPGVVSLHDASMTADDWIALRTTRSSLRELQRAFDWATQNIRPERDWRLLLPAGQDHVALDEQFNEIARIAPDYAAGYVCRGGVETPIAGLRLASGAVAPALGG